MKKALLVLLLSLVQFAFSQDRGTIKGSVTDKEMSGEPLPFANVLIKGTSIGSTTDMDGNYTISAPVGQQTVVFSFVGYETIEKVVNVTSGGTLVVNQEMGASQGEQLEEVEIKATVSKEKESALLLEQKKATIIKESIGAQRLAKVGVSDASGATTKISGVTKSQGSGDVYIRGLGDRYLFTTMNGLPIPSDDVEKKNIDLGLFSTNVIKNVGISKTYTTSNYADQASGNVDIVSKDYSKKGISLSLSGGSNTNILNLEDDFRTSATNENVTLGFYDAKYALVDRIQNENWEPEVLSATPINYSGSLSASHKIGKFSFFGTIGQSKSYEYQTGTFKAYSENILDKEFSQVERFIITDNTTGYLNLELKLNPQNKIQANTLFINKGENNLYEQGRDGLGYVFEQDPQEEGGFVRDQNFKQTTLWVNQLLGEHKWNKNNVLNWAGGFNYVLAEEPNRIRNEVNILDVTDSDLIQYAHVGDFQQRKSSQEIEDVEFNARIGNKWALGFVNDDSEDKPYSLNYGANFRLKERNFESQFIGVRSRGFQAPSVDDLNETFLTITNYNVGFQDQDGITRTLAIREGKLDNYQGELLVIGGYTNFDFEVNEKLSGNLGLRFETNQIDVAYDVTNSFPGEVSKSYKSLFPSVNLKYEIGENQFLRFASGVTQTIPEFKELAPFEYVDPTGRVTLGNPDLEKSDVYNLDLKWEMFPNRGELFSASAFFKQIDSPINKTLTRGSSGNFTFENTGSKATILGLEIEARTGLIKNDDDESILTLSANLTGMLQKQDLLEIYQYNFKTTSGLEGASDFIANASLSYSNNAENEFNATLTGNYSSDKIFSLGAPEDQQLRNELYNDEIIEKGFVTLDFVTSKEINKYLTVKLVGRNLLDPTIKQTQFVRNIVTEVETNETVETYKRGIQLSLGINLSF